MKPKVLVLPSVLCLLLAGACSVGSSKVATATTAPIPTTTTTPLPATTTTTAPPTPDEMFIAAIDQQSLRTGPDPLDSSKMKTDTDAQLLQVAHEICDTVGAGGLPADANSGFKGLTAAEYLAVNEEIGKGTLNAKRVALAIQTICPQFVPILNQALTGKYAKAAPLTTFPDGTYRVGTDIAPGTYQTTTNSSGCYWDRTDANGGTIANNFVTGAPQVRVTISSSDTGFHSDHCGTWAKIG